MKLVFTMPGDSSSQCFDERSTIPPPPLQSRDFLAVALGICCLLDLLKRLQKVFCAYIEEIIKLSATLDSKRIHFEGPNELRALAALAVLFHHLEIYKRRDGIASLYDTSFSGFISGLGKNGVFVFFVLSGFLITYLLLAEKKRTRTILIGKFYFRRILRIWPLYYLVVFISFLFIPIFSNHFDCFAGEAHYFSLIQNLQENWLSPLVLFLCILPNLALKLFPAVVGASQAWSVGVEEQFYAIWPNLVKYLKKWPLFFFVVSLALLPSFFHHLPLVPYQIQNGINEFFSLIPIHFMAMGAIGAFLLFYYQEVVDRFRSVPVFFILNTFVLLSLLYFGSSQLVFGFVVMLEILFITSTSFRFNLRFKPLAFIGKISYGVYMFHPLMMFLWFPVVNAVWGVNQSGVWYNPAIYLTIGLSTLAVSYVSYEYFEKRFIALKNRKYTVIKSG